MSDEEWDDTPTTPAASEQKSYGSYGNDGDDDGQNGGGYGGGGRGRGGGRGGRGGGRGGGGGGGDTCFKCNKSGHFSRECPEAGEGGGRGGQVCYKCNQSGHISRDCPEAGEGGGRGGGSGVCYKCNNSGHIARDCTEPGDGGERRGGGGGRGRGGSRGGRGGGRGSGSGDEGGQENDGEGKAEGEEPPKERYVPAALLEGDELMKERTDLYTGSGINFAAYDSIPVQRSENCTTPVANTFEDLGLRPLVLENVKKMGYKTPTPIQKHASPVIVNQQDLMACAQTGSGKTAGFLLPIINSLMKISDELPCSGDFPVRPSALVLAPTRELAVQIDREAHYYSNGSILRCVCLYGGTAIFHQKSQLSRGCHILVATPGRLKQFLEEDKISLEELKYFVLDEADRMLDMGFMPDVKTIVAKMPKKGDRVAALFSATFPEAIQVAARDFLGDYVFIVIGIVGGACADVEQTFHKVERKEKREKVIEILGEIGPNDKVLIFCNSKKGCDFLAAYLSGKQISSTSIHGDRLQSQRELALREFTQGKRKVLVATAVAARGLDIPKVTMVINYDLPPAEQVDEYIHRIGRTGRVGHTGKAVSFYEEENDAGIAEKLVKILKEAGQSVPDFFDDVAGGGGGGDAFGASDHRMNGNVPAAVEANDDEWE